MFWIFIIICLICIVLFNLGAMSMLLSLLIPAFKVAMLVLGAMGIFLLYLQHGRKN